MHVKVNAGTMHQNTLYQWLRLARPWRGHIQRRIVLCQILVLCLSILNTTLVVQAESAENEDATNTSSDGSTTPTSPTDIEAENDSLLEAKDVIFPQSALAAIILLVDGLVWGLSNSRNSSGTNSSRKFRPTRFMISFTSVIIGVYLSCVFIVISDDGEVDSNKKIVCIVLSAVLGLLAGILSSRYRYTDNIALGCVISSILGARNTVDLANIAINDTTSLIAFRILCTVIPMVALALQAYETGPLMISFAKSYLNGCAVALGIDFFAKTGLTAQMESFFSFNSERDQLNTEGRILVVFQV
jgi:hypothetical protein